MESSAADDIPGEGRDEEDHREAGGGGRGRGTPRTERRTAPRGVVRRCGVADTATRTVDTAAAAAEMTHSMHMGTGVE